MFTIGDWRVKVRQGSKSQTVNVRPAGTPDGEHVWRVRVQEAHFTDQHALESQRFESVEDLIEFLKTRHAGVVELSPRTAVRILTPRAPDATSMPAAPDADLVEIVGGPTAPFRPELGGRLSTLFGWTADEDRLCVASLRANATFAELDLGFARALGHVGDRDLWIIAPLAYARVVADRAAFLDVPIKVWGTAGGEVRPVGIPRPEDIFTKYREEKLGVRDHDLGRGQEWLAPLIAWADGRRLVAQVLNGYRSWQIQGRQVLKATANPAGDRITVVAGTDYEPGRGMPEATKKTITGPLDRATLELLVAAAEQSIEARLDGRDAENLEHLLQEGLVEAARWKRLGLAPGHMARELRTMWPDELRRNGFIDLVGVDEGGTVHVIETKIGTDTRLVLQALDYWIWATANIALVGRNLEIDGPHRVAIDFVVAEKTHDGEWTSPYTAAQAEALGGAVPWRFVLVRNWKAGAPDIVRLDPRTVPDGPDGAPTPRLTTPRWTVLLHDHLATRASTGGYALTRGSYWPAPADGLLPAARDALAVLAAKNLDHEHVGHIRSSQAFALNLFAPLDTDALLAICRKIGIDAVSVEQPEFEFSDPGDHLGEATRASRHTTQVDVLLRARTASGNRHAALIEVKLTEPGFNRCSASLSPDNDALEVCMTSGPFGNDAERCFQLRNRGREHRRQYDIQLGTLPEREPTDRSDGCWFRTANQPMRNVALARVLVTSGECSAATVALCAPLGHASIWRRWTEARSHLEGVGGVNLADLPADQVVALHPERDQLAARYLLEPSD